MRGARFADSKFDKAEFQFTKVGGASYLQDRFNAKVIMSEADWTLLEGTRATSNLRPEQVTELLTRTVVPGADAGGNRA